MGEVKPSLNDMSSSQFYGFQMHPITAPTPHTSVYNGTNSMQLPVSLNADAWDDSEVVDAFEQEKRAGNVYISSDEEAAYPGNWIPVTSASKPNWGAVPVVAPVIPFIIPPTPPQAKVGRGNGKLFQTVFPEEAPPRGKLYKAVVPHSPSPDLVKKPETTGTITPGSMEPMLQAHYASGYQAGYAAALLEMESVRLMSPATPPFEEVYNMNGGNGDGAGLYYF